MPLQVLFVLKTLLLFFIILILFIVSYMFYLNIRYNPITPSQETQKIIVRPSIPPQTISSRHDIFNDPYAPPLKSDGLYFRNDSSDIRGVPLFILLFKFLLILKLRDYL